jgi:hypothetical protein
LRTLRLAPLLLALAACGGAACRSDLVVGTETEPDAGTDAGEPDTGQVDAASDGYDTDAGISTLAQGLIAYWKLDDQAGTDRVIDSSGQGNTANPQSISGSDWQVGHKDGGLKFGRAGWVRAEPSASLNAIATAVSIGLWMNLTGTFPDEQLIVARQKGTTAEVDFALRLRAGYAGFTGATLGPPCEAPVPLPLDRWFALAATYDGAQARLFVDGVVATSCPVTGAFPTGGGRVTIGARIDSADPFDTDERLGPAVLDEVVLYDRALTGGEVGALASGQSPR